MKGRVTIPAEVRLRLGMRAGDKMTWSVMSNGTLGCRPQKRQLTSIRGLINPPGRSGVSIDDMRLPD